MKNTDYNVTIREASGELSTVEKIKMKDTSGAIRLDDATKIEPVVIDVAAWAVLDIHNERTKGADSNKDYTVLVIVDETGERYTTGSNSFITAFFDIEAELSEAGELDKFRIKAYRLPSSNYKDKEFLTCSII